MKKLLALPFLFLFVSPALAETYNASCYVKDEQLILVNVNRVCAASVGIPYASDNFSDKDWKRFQKCVKFMRQFDGVQ